jgi:hypothetical protein
MAERNPSKPRQVNLVFTPGDYAGLQRIAEAEQTTVTQMLWEHCHRLLEEKDAKQRNK